VPNRRAVLALSLLLAACGCACDRPQTCLALPPCGGDVVFVANSSGDFRTTGAGLRRVVEEDRVPLHVEDFVWSHGYGRYVLDHVDHANHREQGHRLACLVAEHRRGCPSGAVYLVGHSAGSAVILAAMEELPRGVVERVVLLGPSVACDYDLRPALARSRLGIDVFTSRRDVVQLGVGVGIAGTADRKWAPAAGRLGFCPIVTCPQDGALYAKLREHPWDECVACGTGYEGLHFGTARPEFMRAVVLPLLVRR
jgi:pimeloyl-ACP methyl ester carboxylesterase